jgi:hypothetical protein
MHIQCIDQQIAISQLMCKYLPDIAVVAFPSIDIPLKPNTKNEYS